MHCNARGNWLKAIANSRPWRHAAEVNERANSTRASDRIRIRSSLPGRHRFWIAGLYRNEPLEAALRQGLTPPASQRSVSANLVTGTLLVRLEEPLDPGRLVERIDRILSDFSARTGTPLAELEQRGQRRPVHLSLNGHNGTRRARLISPEAPPKSERNGEHKPSLRLNLLISR